jgi:hypothetical protein
MSAFKEIGLGALREEYGPVSVPIFRCAWVFDSFWSTLTAPLE